MTKNILLSATVALFLIGCGTTTPQPKNNTEIKTNNQLYTEEETKVFKRLQKLKNENVGEIKSGIHKKDIKKKMLKNDAVYAYEKREEAIVENKKSDEFAVKPLFLEPKFAKVEIMAYETENGLYHEQQSVWLKVKEGEIVMKSNSNGNNTDSFSGILGK